MVEISERDCPPPEWHIASRLYAEIWQAARRVSPRHERVRAPRKSSQVQPLLLGGAAFAFHVMFQVLLAFHAGEFHQLKPGLLVTAEV